MNAAFLCVAQFNNGKTKNNLKKSYNILWKTTMDKTLTRKLKK